MIFFLTAECPRNQGRFTEHIQVSCTVPTTDLQMQQNTVQGAHVVKKSHSSFCPGKTPALLRWPQGCHCNDPKTILESNLPCVNHVTTVSVLLGSKKFQQCARRYTYREMLLLTVSRTVRLTPLPPFYGLTFVLC